MILFKLTLAMFGLFCPVAGYTKDTFIQDGSSSICSIVDRNFYFHNLYSTIGIAKQDTIQAVTSTICIHWAFHTTVPMLFSLAFDQLLDMPRY